MLKVSRKSQLTGNHNTLELDVTVWQMIRFENRIANGEYVQTIFPQLNADEREFIKTGITPKEWEETFGSMPR